MTNQDFRTALKEGKTEVIFTDINGKEYVHTILKAGKVQVNLFNNFLNKEYKLKFFTAFDFTQYRLK